MNDRQLETALAYLNENSGRYSLEALRGQLLQSGYDPVTVDQAIQVHQGNTPGPPKTRAGRKILLVVGVDVLLAAAALGLAALGTTGQAPGILGFIVFVLVSLEFLGGLMLCLFKVIHRRPSAATLSHETGLEWSRSGAGVEVVGSMARVSPCQSLTWSRRSTPKCRQGRKAGSTTQRFSSLQGSTPASARKEAEP